ncbi:MULTISPECIES: histidinol-phosphatase HisJ [unclassified Enterococcus]|uniref:histidinol-phosphatase HisJ n=1 Tax=unclassified Enterococcus TaxID=2608891 RepID=UPI001CE13822|nr:MULTISPECIES: histidinol-phosphatase HisJ [unclassified Enterococcus]MCA5014222.1 histidinol-phosphatase HisJ [Enterococcus sp. S23]MCA5017558.1 histidinol-phosphatase HisJ [Enterococcus sp. S22(2020)]
MKRDGHTHTEFCPHGNVEDTESLIRRAIQLGFKEYSITEHAPLPPSIQEKAAGDPLVWTTASMALNDVDNYFKKMNLLKKKYASDILIHIGFELDYFSDYQDWTKDFLTEYGPLTDDGVLSVHFLEGKSGLRGIDYSFEEYRDGIVEHLGSFEQAQTLYYQTVLASLEADLGQWKPTRLGHISLCQKFQNFFDEATDYSLENQALVHTLLSRVKQENYSLDLNTAGFYKQGYQQSYPQVWIIKKALELGIPLVYGSDTHALTDIGRSYSDVENFL